MELYWVFSDRVDIDDAHENGISIESWTDFEEDKDTRFAAFLRKVLADVQASHHAMDIKAAELCVCLPPDIYDDFIQVSGRPSKFDVVLITIDQETLEYRVLDTVRKKLSDVISEDGVEMTAEVPLVVLHRDVISRCRSGASGQQTPEPSPQHASATRGVSAEDVSSCLSDALSEGAAADAADADVWGDRSSAGDFGASLSNVVSRSNSCLSSHESSPARALSMSRDQSVERATLPSAAPGLVMPPALG
eukprot:g10185.t1